MIPHCCAYVPCIRCRVQGSRCRRIWLRDFSCVWSWMYWWYDNGIDSMFEQLFCSGAHDPRPSMVPGIQALEMVACLNFGQLSLEDKHFSNCWYSFDPVNAGEAVVEFR